MFDIAWSELLLIAVIALIFIGPKELPQVLHTLGRMTAKLRRTADDFRRQFEDSVREAGYEDLHKNIQDLRSLNPANQLKDSITRAIHQDYTPKTADLPSNASDSPPAAGLKPHQDNEAKTPGDASPAAALPQAEGAPPAAGGPQPQRAQGEPANDRIAPAA